MCRTNESAKSYITIFNIEYRCDISRHTSMKYNNLMYMSINRENMKKLLLLQIEHRAIISYLSLEDNILHFLTQGQVYFGIIIIFD